MSEKLVPVKVLYYMPDLFPSIEQTILVHYQQDTNDYYAFQLKHGTSGYATDKIRINTGEAFFNECLHSAQVYQWFSKNQIPFEIKSDGKVQLTIFNEVKNSILLVKIRNQAVGDTSLFFIYFHENLSNFQLDKVSEPFSAQHKTMVGHLAYNSIKTLYQVIQSYDNLINTVNDHIQFIVSERDTLKDQLSKLSGKERVEILKMAQYYLNRVSAESGVKACFTDSARIKLGMFSNDVFQLEEIIRQAVGFASAISSPAGTASLLIADYHIRFPEQPDKSVSVQVEDGLPQRLIKTHLLLDRLEHAAAGIKQRNGSLTSANVGKEFPSPISAPAITDALRKHKKRIIQLFDQYPEKWRIIRHEFRPVLNLMNARQEMEGLSA